MYIEYEVTSLDGVILHEQIMNNRKFIINNALDNRYIQSQLSFCNKWAKLVFLDSFESQ